MMQPGKILAAALFAAGCAAGAGGAEAQETGAGRPAAQETSSTEASVEAPLASTDSQPAVKASATPVFHIQLWDAQKTNWEEEALARVAEAGFTVVQNGWRGSFFPSRELLERISRHGLLYGAYIDTRGLFEREATGEEKAAVRHALEAGGRKNEAEYNAFDPTYQAVVARAMKKGLAAIEGQEGLYKLMINSEHSAPLSYDELTKAEAVKAGVMKADEVIPSYNRGVLLPRLFPMAMKFADGYAFIKWFGGEGGDGPINRVAAEAAREARPGVLVTTDPLRDGVTYGQYRGMEILQDWVRVHSAPRDPLSVAYRVERLKAHARHEGKGEIWIGPQLGTKSEDEEEGVYAAPADALEEALWLAAAFGARGVTLWGYDTVRREDALDQDTWGRIGKFKRNLLTNYPELLRAQDAPRKCAVLLSKANLVLSGRVYYEVEDNYEQFYRCLLTAHVQADVLYDDDVLEGRLANYRLVFLPGLEALTPELEKAIGAFEGGGGRVVKWPRLAVRYVDYEITQGLADEATNVERSGNKTLFPHQYRDWRHLQAEKILKEAGDFVEARVSDPDVIANVVVIDGKRRVILVNDKRTYGEWTRQRGYRWCEDEGVACSVEVSVGAGKTAREVKVSLGPAGVVMFGAE